MMTEEAKIILGSAALCVLGAVLLDCGIAITGVTMMVLGIAGIVAGPFVVMFDK